MAHPDKFYNGGIGDTRLRDALTRLPALVDRAKADTYGNQLQAIMTVLRLNRSNAGTAMCTITLTLTSVVDKVLASQIRRHEQESHASWYDRVHDLTAEIAEQDKDGECLEHGQLCPADGKDCVMFVLSNEAARVTMHRFIAKARDLMAERPW